LRVFSGELDLRQYRPNEQTARTQKAGV